SDLSITNTDDPDPVRSLAPLTYTLVVGNAGPDLATSLVLTDHLPAGLGLTGYTAPGWSCSQSQDTVTCSSNNIDIGAISTVILSLTAPVATGPIVNTASVRSDSADPDSTNNSASQTTTVALARADLSIGVAAAPEPVGAAAELDYTLTVSNTGP